MTISGIQFKPKFSVSQLLLILFAQTLQATPFEENQVYLLASNQFLLDPRRLTVALRGAKRKMIMLTQEIQAALKG